MTLDWKTSRTEHQIDGLNAIGSAASFIVVEYCPDIIAHCGDEIAIIPLGLPPHVEPRVHKLVGWLDVAASLSVEELDLIIGILHDIATRIRSSQHALHELLQWENTIRIRGPFSADDFAARYELKLLR